MIPCGMRVPVAVWQPCELLCTCYSLPYLYLTLPYQLPGDSPGVIYKTAVAATEAVNRGFVEQKTSGLLANLTTTAGGAGGDQATSCRLRVHRGGGAAAVQRGSVAAAGAPPGTKMRHSADSADSANTIQRSARGGDAALFQVALGTRQQVESSI